MVYEKINQFIKTVGISRSKLYRFYKRNDELWEETKIKGGKRFIPDTHHKYFDNEILYDELKNTMLEIKSLRNLIDCLADKDTLQRTLWEMDWSFFFTIAYKAERNKKSCFRLMNALFDDLQTKFGHSTELRIFFTTEPFNNRTGYHNHFIIHVSDKNLKEQIVKSIQDFFEYDRVDSSLYDRYRAGLFYIAKDGLQNEDWDFLSNINTGIKK